MYRDVDVTKTIFIVLLIILACPAMAQELFVNGGVTQDAKTSTTEGQWSVTYRQSLPYQGIDFIVLPNLERVFITVLVARKMTDLFMKSVTK